MPHSCQQVPLGSQCNHWALERHHKCLKPCEQLPPMLLYIRAAWRQLGGNIQDRCSPELQSLLPLEAAPDGHKLHASEH